MTKARSLTGDMKKPPSLGEAGTDAQIPARKENSILHQGLLGKQMLKPDRKGEYLAGKGHHDLNLV